ncbi:MAG: hypothetical protein ACREOU_15245 [Candidatus Eiseniibacteriota bacterium]
MKAGMPAALLACVLFAGFSLATPPSTHAASERPNLIWARATASAITLDGVLSEPAWAQAESMTVTYGVDSGIPGSGWKGEGGFNPTDKTRAVFRFLTNGNQLYVAAVVPDSSIGGSPLFNFFDALLMAIKDHASLDRPAPPAEYFYAWWTNNGIDSVKVDLKPWFFGRWGSDFYGDPRTAEDIANWDAFTLIEGRSNTDTLHDSRWVAELRFNLTPMGYNIQQVNGDVIEWNVSVYDCDWNWPISPPPHPTHGHRVSANRVWWESPWGNDHWYDQVRIYARPSVTTGSGALPTVGPDLTIPNAGSSAAPVVDGLLNDAVWGTVPGFDIRYGDTALRNTYAGVGKYRSGQFQPDVDGGQDFVSNPGDATIKWVVKNDSLFIAFDARDEVVQAPPEYDRFDGFLFTIDDRLVRNPDNALIGRRMLFRVNSGGTAEALDYLAAAQDSGKARVRLQLKPGTTVDELGNDVDAGYTAELVLDLTKFGYPAGLGDRIIFPGISLLDGDTYNALGESYGTRTWFWREYEGQCCPPWTVMASSGGVGVDPDPTGVSGFVFLSAAPNPFREGQTVQFQMGSRARVDLQVYDARGALVRDRPLGVLEAGLRQATWSGQGLPAGVYLVRLRITDPASGAERAKLSGKAILLR